MSVKARSVPPSRTLLDFGAGLVIGLSITVALFAAMEEDSAQLRQNLLLAALAALGLAIAMIYAGRARARRPVPRAGRVCAASAAAAGWKVERPRGAATQVRAGASSSNDYRASRDGETRASLPELKAARRNTQTTADGYSRRL
ncbi:MAG TPA: hypothetical protein VH704_08085 [Casimicrobiaceae bacterium]|jgi:hypothetical protein|nr:hypothetical protein [Casimicrobiaceae bacterium]